MRQKFKVFNESKRFDQMSSKEVQKKANIIRESMQSLVGAEFAKKALDEDIVKMADLKDECSAIHNQYIKEVKKEIDALNKKYKIGRGSISENLKSYSNPTNLNELLEKLGDSDCSVTLYDQSLKAQLFKAELNRNMTKTTTQRGLIVGNATTNINIPSIDDVRYEELSQSDIVYYVFLEKSSLVYKFRFND